MELFPYLQDEINVLHLGDFCLFVNYECQLYLNQPLTRPQRKIIATYRTLNHRFAIELGWQSTIPISKDNRLCHSSSYNAVENEALCVGVSPT